ncbi:4-alpha-glucanotransferase [Ruficoccus amylovorans]|uniref:4-alpha-glucanotransferase n=1 Tax=Ruficoccus amylovorans TaxID=1804625 RepID=A0A842HC40_9BACT|nr:4-alpha-glucanotransferase [Ruficoccus amylovorans]MBC2594033.1 4-alpha-glucanotransferase [Ruficoccus amylovorans]
MDSPLFPWLEKRHAGVLLHPTSLPGDLGIGQLGREARRLVDFLAAAGIRYWQLCPMGPTGYGDSPYQCFSSHAGNPYLIDLQALVGFGLLKDSELKPLRQLPHEYVDYGSLYQRFWPILELACQRYGAKPEGLSGYGSYVEFCEKEADWLTPYAAFTACKAHFKGKPWFEWPKKLCTYRGFQKSDLAQALDSQMDAVRFTQYLFFAQWRQLRAYAAEKGVGIIGDVPIFVALDSADVWTRPELFQLGKDGQPTAVAGVPPDYFSPLGQLWGNPLFDWEQHKKDGYAWWIQRLEANFRLYDVVRLDHFRGFESYWSIPAGAKDARGGKWEAGPGLDFFRAVQKAIPEAKLIAEDLGDITPEVRAMHTATGLPGMAILQFAFGSGPENLYLPHNLSRNSATYPGVHDNDTTLGWYRSADGATQDHFRRYFGVDGSVPQWDCVRAAYRSVSRLAVIPMQDLMNLGSEARLNRPGEAAGNWQWRYHAEQLDTLWRGSATYLRGLAELYGRLEPEDTSSK